MIFSKLQGNQLKLRLFILETPPKIHQKDELYVYNINSQILAPKISSSKKNHFPIPENKLSAEKFRFLHQKKSPFTSNGYSPIFLEQFSKSERHVFLNHRSSHRREKHKKTFCGIAHCFPTNSDPDFQLCRKYYQLLQQFVHKFSTPFSS